jgi:hypothetical protein
MPEAEPKKIVYLFGAGATHAELINAEPTAPEMAEERGLLMSNVSSRVIETARRRADYIRSVEMVSGTGGSLNIELLISLIEGSKVNGWESKVETLKSLVQQDIDRILTPELTAQFYLHKALLELHRDETVQAQEQLLGLISLNYESVLDEAYREIFQIQPDYCLSLEKAAGHQCPVLKLHGSFDWRTTGVNVRGKLRKIDMIPLGASKSYDHAPYVFIWSRALEMLVECDILRIIGCSLSQNDTHLIDLLFKAQVESGTGFDMEIVAPAFAGEDIRRTCGFFRGIRTLNEIEGIEIGGHFQGGIVAEANPHANAFKEWLKYKAEKMLQERARDKRYLGRITP